MTTDLHLVDRPDAEYRWKVFDRIEEEARDVKPRALLILGDVTDAKDGHSARLVNRIVDQLMRMKEACSRVIVLQGNHDYLQKETPFLSFINHVPGLRFVTSPCRMREWVLIPHSRTTPLPGLELVDETTRVCFMHQTVSGALTSNGQRMEGEVARLPHLDTCNYYSGDIHVPQLASGVEYVGAPYPVHFGDEYKPRFLVMASHRNVRSVRWQGLRRASASIEHPKDLEDLQLKKDDQLKVRLVLSRDQMADWHAAKRDVQAWCDQRGVRLMSIELAAPPTRRQLVTGVSAPSRTSDPAQVVSRYCRSRGIDDVAHEVGLSIVERFKA